MDVKQQNKISIVGFCYRFPSHPTTLSASPTLLLFGQLTRLPFHSGYATVCKTCKLLVSDFEHKFLHWPSDHPERAELQCHRELRLQRHFPFRRDGCNRHRRKLRLLQSLIAHWYAHCAKGHTRTDTHTHAHTHVLTHTYP